MNIRIQRKLTAAKTTALLEALSDSDFDDNEFDGSDDEQHFKCI